MRVIDENDGLRDFDSRILGPFREDRIRHWWVPAVQAGGQGGQEQDQGEAI